MPTVKEVRYYGCTHVGSTASPTPVSVQLALPSSTTSHYFCCFSMGSPNSLISIHNRAHRTPNIACGWNTCTNRFNPIILSRWCKRWSIFDTTVKKRCSSGLLHWRVAKHWVMRRYWGKEDKHKCSWRGTEIAYKRNPSSNETLRLMLLDDQYNGRPPEQLPAQTAFQDYLARDRST